MTETNNEIKQAICWNRPQSPTPILINMGLDLHDIQQSLKNLERINEKKQNLIEVMYTKIAQQEEQHNQLNTVITNLSARLNTTTDLKGKLETENRMLRRKIRRLEDEFLSSLRQ